MGGDLWPVSKEFVAGNMGPMSFELKSVHPSRNEANKERRETWGYGWYEDFGWGESFYRVIKSETSKAHPRTGDVGRFGLYVLASSPPRKRYPAAPFEEASKRHTSLSRRPVRVKEHTRRR